MPPPSRRAAAPTRHDTVTLRLATASPRCRSTTARGSSPSLSTRARSDRRRAAPDIRAVAPACRQCDQRQPEQIQRSGTPDGSRRNAYRTTAETGATRIGEPRGRAGPPASHACRRSSNTVRDRRVANGDPCRADCARRLASGTGARSSARSARAAPQSVGAGSCRAAHRPPPRLRRPPVARRRYASRAAGSDAARARPRRSPKPAVAALRPPPAAPSAAEPHGRRPPAEQPKPRRRSLPRPRPLLVRSTPAGARVSSTDATTDRRRRRARSPRRHAPRPRRRTTATRPRSGASPISASRPAQSLTIRASAARPTASPRRRRAADAGGVRAVRRRAGRSIRGRRARRCSSTARPVGTTPLRCAQCRAGEHAVRLEHDGYRRWSRRYASSPANRIESPRHWSDERGWGRGSRTRARRL